MKIGKASLAVFAALLLPVAASAKTLVVGSAFRTLFKYDEATVMAMVHGVNAARYQFEKTHPGVKIALRQYAHGEDLASVSEIGKRIVAEKVPILIGAEMSSEAIVLGDIFKEIGTVLVSPTASSPRIFEARPNVFSVCFSDRQVAQKLSEFAAQVLKPRGVGIVRKASSPYSDYLAGQFTQDLRKIPGAPLAVEKTFLDSTAAFGEMVKEFKEKNLEVVAFLGQQADFFPFVLLANSLDYFPVYIGSDGLGTNERIYEFMVKNAKKGESFRAYRNAYWKEDLSTKEAKAFAAALRKVSREKPNAWSAIAYDAAMVAFNGANAAEDPKSGASIGVALKKIQGLKLVTTSSFSFAPDNSPNKDLYIYQIDKNGFRYETTLR